MVRQARQRRVHPSQLGADRGLPEDLFDGRPVIGICNTWSELTPCNAHLRELADHVKRGVWEAGGLPFEFPVTSLGETSVRPTAMLFATCVSMDVEESIRANPIDGVVLLCGCDKTTPALVMGAASCDVPALVRLRRPDAERQVPRRRHRLGHRRVALQRGGQGRHDEPQEFMRGRACMSRSSGHLQRDGHGLDDGVDGRGARAWRCRTTRPFRRSIRAATRWRTSPAAASSSWCATTCGCLKILTRAGVRERDPRQRRASADRPTPCIHLLAMAGRVGVPLTLEDWDRLGRDVPTIVDLMPSGRFLMEDFYYAGGLPAVMRALGEHGLLQSRRADGQRQDDLGELPRGAELQRRSDPADRTSRSPRTAASRCCAAISRRTARCSSRRRRRRT